MQICKGFGEQNAEERHSRTTITIYYIDASERRIHHVQLTPVGIALFIFTKKNNKENPKIKDVRNCHGNIIRYSMYIHDTSTFSSIIFLLSTSEWSLRKINKNF